MRVAREAVNRRWRGARILEVVGELNDEGRVWASEDTRGLLWVWVWAVWAAIFSTDGRATF